MVTRFLIAFGAIAAVALALIIGVPVGANAGPCAGTAAVGSSPWYPVKEESTDGHSRETQ